jgi:hypothetical protein
MATAPRHPTVRDRLIAAIVGVEFPAERWQVVACAAAERADVLTCSRLARIPCRTYADIAEVLEAALPPARSSTPGGRETGAPATSFRVIRRRGRSSIA